MGHTLRPLKNKILVRQDPKKEKLGSLYLPDNSRELYSDLGTVEVVGDDIKSVNPGDRVIFKRRPASSLEDHGFEGLLLLLEEDLIAVVTDE